MKIVKEFIEDEMQVTEYDNGYIVKVPVQAKVTPGEVIPVPPTFDERLKSVEETITALLGL